MSGVYFKITFWGNSLGLGGDNEGHPKIVAENEHKICYIFQQVPVLWRKSVISILKLQASSGISAETPSYFHLKFLELGSSIPDLDQLTWAATFFKSVNKKSPQQETFEAEARKPHLVHS